MFVSVVRSLLLLALALGPTRSSYLISTPRRWTLNFKSQVCVTLTEGAFGASDALAYSLTEVEHGGVLTPETPLQLPAGESSGCLDVEVPSTDDRHVTLQFGGTLANDRVDFAVNLTFVKEIGRTFIQTDKYLYRPGQKVQFRVLSVNGPNLEVVTNNYDEVYVKNPQGTRIAQWRNVDNSQGLIHLDFDLFKEADDGVYRIGVRLGEKAPEEKVFRVEDYVLPRYEVTVRGPDNILGSDETVTLTLCAKYTFGEPVNGNATLSVAGGSWKYFANLTESKKISGCENFTFPTDQLLFDQNNCHIRVTNLRTTAVVEEDGTDVQLTGENPSIPVHRQAVLFSDQSANWVQKKFLPQPIKIAATFPDGSAVKEELMEVCTYYEGEDICKNMTTCKKGFLSFLLPSQADSRVEIKAVNYPRIEKNWNNVMEESKYSKYSFSSEEYVNIKNESLTIYLEDKLNCTTGQNIKVDVPIIYIVNNLTSTNVHIQVISRGQVVNTQTQKVDFVEKELPFKGEEHLLPLEALPSGFTRGFFNVLLDLPETTSPKIQILVWYSDNDKVVVADTKEVEITECLPHKVDFSWSTDRVEPGKTANLVLNGASNALCSVGVVDKSVELLSGDNNKLDISTILGLTYNSEVARWDSNQLNLDFCYKKYGSDVTGTGVEEDIRSANPEQLEAEVKFKRYSDVEALHMFSNAGYYVISNLFLEKLYCNKLIIEDLKNQFESQVQPRPITHRTKVAASPQAPVAEHFVPSHFAAGAGGGFAADNDLSPAQKEGVVETPQERSYLPETWLWRLQPLSVTGDLNEPVTLPDTITEWVGKAVCVHPTEGVGVSPAASITTFTPFFVDLTLPASAQRGETLPVKISIFNYLEEDLPVKLTVNPSANFSFVEGETGERHVCVPSKVKSVQTIKVDLAAIGDVNFTIDAVAEPMPAGSCGSGTPPDKKDRFIRSIPVEPEGYVREKTWTKYVCSQDLENLDQPIADTWNIKTPEAIVEGSERAWITAMGDLLGPTVENIGHLVRFPSGCGEQNMINFAPNVYILQYLEASGQLTEKLREKLVKFLDSGYQSQQTFRHPDGLYSTFGTKDPEGSTWLTAFVVKSFKHAAKYVNVDEAALKTSVDLLLTMQKEDGCFESRGRVINKILLGGLQGSARSEALLTAYVLAALAEGDYLPAEAKNAAVACIEKDTSDHPYALALKSYALALAGAPRATEFADKLLSVAVSNSSAMRWALPDTKGENTAQHVETAAYALLAFVAAGPARYTDERRRIVRWLSGQRNGRGGFVSTQDTVVALQALAAFEKTQKSGPLNLVVKPTAPGVDGSFTITDDNRFLQQLLLLPKVPVTVDIGVEGEGCGLTQGVLRYNVLADSESDAFSLNVSTKAAPDNDCRSHLITVCASYTLPDGASNMALIEVRLVSGYVPLKQDLRDVLESHPSFKRYEVDGPKVFFYLEEVTADPVCASFRVTQEVEIENAKPGTVKVFDYYQPEFLTTQKFSLPPQDCPA